MPRILLLLAFLAILPATSRAEIKCEPFTIYLEELSIKSEGNAVGDVGIGQVKVFAADQTHLGFQIVTTMIAPGANSKERRLIVNAYLTLGDNQLNYSGTYPAPNEADSVPGFETELAVTGGTGVFKGAFGQVSFVTKDSRRAAEFDISCNR